MQVLRQYNVAVSNEYRSNKTSTKQIKQTDQVYNVRKKYHGTGNSMSSSNIINLDIWHYYSIE